MIQLNCVCRARPIPIAITVYPAYAAPAKQSVAYSRAKAYAADDDEGKMIEIVSRSKGAI